MNGAAHIREIYIGMENPRLNQIRLGLLQKLKPRVEKCLARQGKGRF